ncbi:MAG: 50S ribosomal protein L17, partial [Anaerolineales bacterium]
MRHRVNGKRLGRSTGHRKALRRNLISDLFRYERIRTTKAKAASVRGASEKLITMAKHADEDDQVHARRMAAKRLGDPEVVMKLFDDIAPRYVDRPGGYTRMLKLGPRKGDGAEMVLL